MQANSLFITRYTANIRVQFMIIIVTQPADQLQELISANCLIWSMQIIYNWALYLCPPHDICFWWGQTYVPTPLSSDTPMFLQPMFLRPYVPTPLCSDTPMFRHPYTPSNPCEPCSYTLMFLHPYVPTPLCSYSPICRQSVVCPVLGNNFQNVHRNRSWTTND